MQSPQKLIDALHGYRCQQVRGRDSWRSRCPGHGGSKQNLYIDVKDGKVLIHCFAGCDSTDVLGAIGLRWSDLGVETTRPVYDPLEDRIWVELVQSDLRAGKRVAEKDLARYQVAKRRLEAQP